jgi:hypothetical protein
MKTNRNATAVWRCHTRVSRWMGAEAGAWMAMA